MKNMLRLTLLLLACAGILPALAQGREEFNGPFASWANVKTRFGAHGNGKDDDTRAIQTALDSLSCPPTNYNTGNRAYMVVYLPAGTYCVSSTLVLRGKIGVSIVGEDPAKTIIKWTGPAKDTVLWTNGSAYFSVSRLTLDASGLEYMEGIGIHWMNKWRDANSRSFATVNIEITDCIFNGAFQHAIGGGTGVSPEATGANDSEVAIRRCTFRNCIEAGIDIHGYNALDYWVWDCNFIKCYIGVKNVHGNFHVFRCYFSGSLFSDTHSNMGYYTSVRGCYSDHSHAFALDAASSCNPFKRTFQDNQVISPSTLAVEYYHVGKLTFMGNTFTRSVDSTPANINYKGWCPAWYEVLSLHNTYELPHPIRIASNPQHLYSYMDQDSVKVKPALQTFLSSMDRTPAYVPRKIFEVPPGADAAAIQTLIDQASLLRGFRPVLHFAMGSYNIDRPLIIPAGSDMQWVGDGLIDASVLQEKQGLAQIPAEMIHVKGPSYISFRNLQIGKDGNKEPANAIVFENIDQPGAQTHLDQIYSHADTSLSVRNTNYLYLQKDNSFFTEGNYISGGPLVQKGKGTARIACFGGQFAGLYVQNNARFVAKDCWWEGDRRIPLDLQGSGNITIDGSMIAPNHVDSGTTIHIGNFKGQVTLANMYVQGALSVEANNPDLSLLAWNIHFYHKMDVLSFLPGARYKAAFLGLNAQCFRSNDPECKDIAYILDKLVGVSDVNPFLDNLTAADRECRPVLLKNLPAGTSNIYLSRVSVLGSRKTGLIFSAQ